MKRALVLSGGGCKGAYQAGALLYLSNSGINFDIICGSSVGAMNASFLSQYPKENFNEACKDLVLFWTSLKQEQIYKRWFPFGKLHALWEKSLYNSEPRHKLIEKNIDIEKLQKSNVELIVGTVSVNSGLYKTYNNKNINIKKAIMASSAFPPFFSPVKIDDELEFDAGLKEYTPIRDAIKAGATEIYIICSETENMEYINPEKYKTLQIFKRFVSILASEVITNDFNLTQEINKNVLSGICKDKKYIKCHIIKPQKELTDDSINFDHKLMTKLIEIGYNDANKQITHAESA